MSSVLLSYALQPYAACQTLSIGFHRLTLLCCELPILLVRAPVSAPLAHSVAADQPTSIDSRGRWLRRASARFVASVFRQGRLRGTRSREKVAEGQCLAGEPRGRLLAAHGAGGVVEDRAQGVAALVHQDEGALTIDDARLGRRRQRSSSHLFLPGRTYQPEVNRALAGGKRKLIGC
jgi:hypothetical protein